MVYFYKPVGVFLLFFTLFSCSKTTDSESNIVHSARTAYLTGENITAEDLYKSYLKDFPNGKYRLEAWERIYDITVNLRKDKINAVPLLGAMLMEYANNEKLYAEILKRSAFLHLDLAKYEESIQLWTKYLDLNIISDSERNKARLQLSKQYLLLSKFDSALQLLRVCNESKDTEEYYSLCQLQEAQVLIRMSQFDAATSILYSIRSVYSKSSNIFLEASFLLGDIFETINHKSEAVKMYESILDSYPNTQAIKTRLNNLKSN